MQLSFSPLTVEQFLAEYWQQQPIVIKGAISHFENPVSADELAGLATAPNIESRLISQSDEGHWSAESGPFDSYEAYGQRHWSLVVQSVNHWLPTVQDFARLFDFIPQWRLDDVMVSFAAPDGGVGPHVDNYDVFICQGSGQRRWRVGAVDEVEEVIAHEKLRHVKPFNAVIDEVLNAGDVLYIPPGFPHEGVSLDESMSFSVGYKSTHTTELLSGFADYLIDFDDAPVLLSDKQRQRSHYGQIDNNDFDRLQQCLQQTLTDTERLCDFFGMYYSQSRSELDLAEAHYDYEEWLAIFQNQPLQKLYAVKSLYLSKNIEKGIFYFDGERHQLATQTDTLRRLCDDSELHFADVNDASVLKWLWHSSNRGYWYFD